MTRCMLSWSNDPGLQDLVELENVLMGILEEHGVPYYDMVWGDGNVSVDGGMMDAEGAEALIREVYERASSGALRLTDVTGAFDI